MDLGIRTFLGPGSGIWNPLFLSESPNRGMVWDSGSAGAGFFLSVECQHGPCQILYGWFSDSSDLGDCVGKPVDGERGRQASKYTEERPDDGRGFCGAGGDAGGLCSIPVCSGPGTAFVHTVLSGRERMEFSAAFVIPDFSGRIYDCF